MRRRNVFGGAALFALLAGSATTGYAQIVASFGTAAATTTATTTTTVTNATGTIAQLNYGEEGQVEGFLVGSTILLSFPGNICGGVGSLGIAGNSITYSGTAVTTSAGFQSVMVTSFTNNSTKATYTRTTAASTAYGPTSGTIKQLNYTADGSIDGFILSAGSTSVFVSVGSRASTTLKPLLSVGATVSVTGTTSTGLSACSASGTLTTVEASSLTVGTQTIVIAGGGSGGSGGFGGRGGRH